MKEAFALTAEEVVNIFGVDINTGLSTDEAAIRLTHFGRNRIEKKDAVPIVELITRQFRSPLVALLVFAAALSFSFDERLDGIAILAVIFVNALIGFTMEFKAGRAMDALTKFCTTSVRVLRNSKLSAIDATNLVPGDIVFFETGDMVSADARILKCIQLQTDESSLTGESLPVNKTSLPLTDNTPLADKRNMLFNGTFIIKGSARAVVVTTGMNTELGEIAGIVQQAKNSITPLEKRLEQLSRQLIKVTIALVLIIFFAGWMSGRGLIDMLQTSIALAVATIPEGLPIVATIALANGMIRMKANNVIVRKLSAIETLGGANIICTDKTGTLTENQMTVVDFPYDNVLRSRMLEASVLCNTAEIDNSGKEIGDPLEVALLRYIRPASDIDRIRKQFPKLKEEPFTSETKRMATAHQYGNAVIVFAKGAPEEIVQQSNRIFQAGMVRALDHAAKQKLLIDAHQLSARGYKVIGFGFQEHTCLPNDLFSDLIFLGFISLADPPRKNIREDIEKCKSAGIKVVMVTGDHAATAAEIARQIGIEHASDANVINGSSMKSFDELNASDKQAWLNASVFARVSPLQKLDLVKVFQEKKNIVCMTGDGINDAPALKKADIGIAMGLRGTQVAQEVSDIVLKDDLFSSIVSAIHEGRIIFENIRKFAIYLISCNLSELIIIAVCAIFNFHFQLLPLQILFINIITDVLPALALGLTAGDPVIMKKRPREMNTPIIDTGDWLAIVKYSIIITASCVASVSIAHAFYYSQMPGHTTCNSILFMTVIVTQLLHAFNMNTERRLLHSAVFRNKFLWYSIFFCLAVIATMYCIPIVREVFSITVLSATDWLIIIASSILPVLIIQFAKAHSRFALSLRCLKL